MELSFAGEEQLFCVTTTRCLSILQKLRKLNFIIKKHNEYFYTDTLFWQQSFTL